MAKIPRRRTDSSAEARSPKAPSAQAILAYFRSRLVTTTTKYGEKAAIAKADCMIMLMLIQRKINNPQERISRDNPGRFRGTKDLGDAMKQVLGDNVRPHIPKWGATAVRGNLRTDEKRGNKNHIVFMIDLLNAYQGKTALLKRAFTECITLHHDFWERQSLQVLLQPDDPSQHHLLELLAIPSLGRVQQGLVYSTLRRRYGGSRKVTTKKTFAGDDQSSMGGVIMKGDVQVWDGPEIGRLDIALEVKDTVIGEIEWCRVAETHGAYDYDLFVLGTGFNPPSVQRGISGKHGTYALHLADYMLAIVFGIATDEGLSMARVLEDVVGIYNDEFCELIEQDTSLRINIGFHGPAATE